MDYQTLKFNEGDIRFARANQPNAIIEAVASERADAINTALDAASRLQMAAAFIEAYLTPLPHRRERHHTAAENAIALEEFRALRRSAETTETGKP